MGEFSKRVGQKYIERGGAAINLYSLFVIHFLILKPLDSKQEVQ
jgi:hypothetical protein